MNRIDHRPAALALNSTDGAQLQRHMLQELERQWLDSWGTASAAQSDSAPVPQSSDRPPDIGGAASNDLHAEAIAESARPGSRLAASWSGRAGETTAASTSLVETRAAMAASEKSGNTPAPPVYVGPGVAPMFSPPGGDAPTGKQMPPRATEPPRDASDGAWHHPTLAAMPLDAPGSQPAGLAMGAAALAAQPPLALTAPAAASLAPAREAEEARESTASVHQKRQLSGQADGDAGPRKLTLRELAPDLIQATLRDTQLDLGTSRLAAQGLARALMEAGYAQAKVVVNGQASRGEPIEGDGRPSAPVTTSAPFTKTASKDSLHGN